MAREEGRAEGRQEERTAAATWLREQGLDYVATMIERGEHRLPVPKGDK